MTNSQTYGPSQVRDLSESWGEDAPNVKVFPSLTSGLPEAKVQSIAPEVESHPLASASFQPRSISPASPSQRRWATGKFSGLVSGSHVSHTTWIGARFSRVKGSSPSTTTYGGKCRPVYLTLALRRINTLAAKKHCGS